MSSVNNVSPAVRVQFIQAAKEGKLDVIKKFIENGTDVNTTDVLFALRVFLLL